MRSITNRYWTMAQVVNLLKKGVSPKYRFRRKDWSPGRYIQRSPSSDVAIVQHLTGYPLQPWSPTIKEPVAEATVERLSQANLFKQKGSDRVPGKTNGPMKAVSPASWKGSRFDTGKTNHHQLCRAQKNGNRPGRSDGGAACNELGQEKRNRRSVWTVSTKGYKDAHFATFPPDLIEPCILAGCPKGGTVIDPFNGSGTTEVVCLKHGRRFIGIEINEEYCAMAVERLRQGVLFGPNEKKGDR